MSEPTPLTYSVLLRVEKTDPCYSIYRMFAELPLEISGQSFLQLSGDQLESDGHYLRVRLLVPEELRGLVAWIPHRYVALMMSDDQNRPPIGFGRL